MPVAPPTTVNIRYMVHDVHAAIAWCTKHLGFTVLSQIPPLRGRAAHAKIIARPRTKSVISTYECSQFRTEFAADSPRLRWLLPVGTVQLAQITGHALLK